MKLSPPFLAENTYSQTNKLAINTGCIPTGKTGKIGKRQGNWRRWNFYKHNIRTKIISKLRKVSARVFYQRILYSISVSFLYYYLLSSKVPVQTSITWKYVIHVHKNLSWSYPFIWFRTGFIRTTVHW